MFVAKRDGQERAFVMYPDDKSSLKMIPVSALEPGATYLGVTGSSSSWARRDGATVFDVEFYRYIVDIEGRSQEATRDLVFIDHVLESKRLIEDDVFDRDLIHSSLVKLLMLCIDSRTVTSVLKRYSRYHAKILTRIMRNVERFDKSKLRISEDDVERFQQLESDINLQCDELGFYMPVHCELYKYKTTRIYSRAGTLSAESRRFIVPANDTLVEIDSSASELNFLFYVCGEHDHGLSRSEFWTDLAKQLDLPWLDGEIAKSLVYPMLYGSSDKSLNERTGIDRSRIQGFKRAFSKRFPKSYDFYLKASNAYYDKDSDLVFDYFGKSLKCDSTYKKLNYFLQSSLSTHFQVFVDKLCLLMEEESMVSKVLFTIHDSMFVDLLDSEKKLFFSLVKKANDDDFKMMLRVKSAKKSH